MTRFKILFIINMSFVAVHYFRAIKTCELNFFQPLSIFESPDFRAQQWDFCICKHWWSHAQILANARQNLLKNWCLLTSTLWSYRGQLTRLQNPHEKEEWLLSDGSEGRSRGLRSRELFIYSICEDTVTGDEYVSSTSTQYKLVEVLLRKQSATHHRSRYVMYHFNILQATAWHGNQH